jgi:hypothetical protein
MRSFLEKNRFSRPQNTLNPASRPNAGISLCRRGRARPNLKLLRAETGAPRAPCEISGLAEP